MAIDITLKVTLSVEERGLEDAMEEYDELTVTNLVSQILDKSIALEAVKAEIQEGPDSLEEWDRVREANG